MPAPRPPFRRVPNREAGFGRRVPGVDDVPTTPYGFSLEPVESEFEEAVTAFYVTPEAIPLLPPRKDESQIAPISSLSPAALSAPPVSISEPPPALPSRSPWGRVFLVVGAAATAFVVTAAIGRFAHPRRIALPAAATELRPAATPPVAPESPASSEKVATQVVVAEPVVIATRAPEKAASKARPRRAWAPAKLPPAPAPKVPYRPTEL